jgi:hypothetical protein
VATNHLITRIEAAAVEPDEACGGGRQVRQRRQANTTPNGSFADMSTFVVSTVNGPDSVDSRQMQVFSAGCRSSRFAWLDF